MNKLPFSRQLVKPDLINYRNNFTKLLISNPNYFGNLDSDILPKAVFPIKGNTQYENLEIGRASCRERVLLMV